MGNWENDYLHRNDEIESDYFNQDDSEIECSECYEDMSNENHADNKTICENCRNESINKLQE